MFLPNFPGNIFWDSVGQKGTRWWDCRIVKLSNRRTGESKNCVTVELDQPMQFDNKTIRQSSSSTIKQPVSPTSDLHWALHSKDPLF